MIRRLAFLFLVFSGPAWAWYPYRQTVLADSPGVFFEMLEGTCSTTSWSDSSGNGNNGVCSSGTPAQTGPIVFQPTNNNALKLNGTSDYLDLCNTSGSGAGGCGGAYLDPLSTNSFTIEEWVKFDTLPTVSGHGESITSKVDVKFADPSVGGWQLFVYNAGGGNNKIALNMYDASRNANGFQVLNTSALSTGVWYHIVAAVTLYSSGKIYLNGSDDTASTSHSTTYVTPNDSVKGEAGRDWASDNTPTHQYLPGTIAMTALYNTELSAARVLAHYNCATLGTSCALGPGSGWTQSVKLEKPHELLASLFQWGPEYEPSDHR